MGGYLFGVLKKIFVRNDITDVKDNVSEIKNCQPIQPEIMDSKTQNNNSSQFNVKSSYSNTMEEKINSRSNTNVESDRSMLTR